MSAAPAFDPEWGDDWMAIADAVGITARPHPEAGAAFVPHPSRAEEFTDLALELRLREWATEVLADLPVRLLPTDHDVCCGCAQVLCGCVDQCRDTDGPDGAVLERDVCSHDGRVYCWGCSVHHCVHCRDDAERWGR